MAEAEILQAIEVMDNYLIPTADNVVQLFLLSGKMVKSVRSELRLILDFLAEKKLEEESSSLKYLISDVVEIARDACLVINNRGPWFDFRMKDIFTGLSETRERILQLSVDEANKSSIPSSPLLEGDGNVACLEQDVESVLRRSILCQRRGLFTTCIVGMAGIGKTTLAREVYNHAVVVDGYEPRVWVSFSGEQSNKEVLMKLLLKLLHNVDQSALLEEMENADNEILESTLYQHLQGKRFLIVLDNIGKVPYFRSIFQALPEDEESRLLLTSRFWSIKGRVTDREGASTRLEMRPLNDDQSWQLFLKLLLFADQQFPKKLEKSGREMLRSCNGLPLSIKEVATQFVRKRQSGSRWEELLESIDLSVTFGVLESVYRRWDPQLKLCFLCLSFFKKGSPIKTEKLLQVWVAGQVIPQEEEDKDLDILERYKSNLLGLIDESIFDISKKMKWIKCFRINPSFHTLSMAKAKEEMIFETLKKGEDNPPSLREPRHRAIYCSRDEFNHFTNHDHDKCLVSLFFRGGGYFDASELYWKRFEQLRILDFEGFGLKMVPETVGALTELRYLGLRDNHIQELPRSLGRLKKLEVLDIALNFTVEVPDILWDMGGLRHLYMSDIICWKPLKIDTLKNLETLTYISLGLLTHKVSNLETMTSLCILGIEEVDENSDLRKLFGSLANLSNLGRLCLRGLHFRSLPSLQGLHTLHHLAEIKLDGFITELPSADTFPSELRCLSLINSCLDEDPIPELGKLDNLSYLKLKNAYTGQQMVIQSKSFRNLEVLCIEELWHLRNIQVDDYVPWLKKLEIKSCPYLKDIPKSIVTCQVKEMKMTTTRKLAAKIRKLEFISKIKRVDIQP